MGEVGHRLSIRAKTPKTTVEGELFDVEYTVKNTGDTIYPGGTVAVQISWPQLPGAIVSVPMEITNPLQPNGEFTIKKKETPLATGYTMFTVAGAIAIDGQSVRVCLPDTDRLLWPPPQPGLFQLFYAVRAKSHEEISQRNALWAAIIALIVTAFWSISDLLFRYLLQL